MTYRAYPVPAVSFRVQPHPFHVISSAAIYALWVKILGRPEFISPLKTRFLSSFEMTLRWGRRYPAGGVIPGHQYRLMSSAASSIPRHVEHRPILPVSCQAPPCPFRTISSTASPVPVISSAAIYALWVEISGRPEFISPLKTRFLSSFEMTLRWGRNDTAVGTAVHGRRRDTRSSVSTHVENHLTRSCHFERSDLCPMGRNLRTAYPDC